MIDSHITRVVLGAITSRVKPDWNFFDDLMVWCLEECHDKAAQFVLAAKMADATLSIKDFGLFQWDKFLLRGRSGEVMHRKVFWEKGNKMPAWMFFLITAEGLCVQSTKTMDATVEIIVDPTDHLEIDLLRGITLTDENWLVDWVDIRGALEGVPWGQQSVLIGELSYSIFTQSYRGEQLGSLTVPELDRVLNMAPIVYALIWVRTYFVLATLNYQAANVGGELYVAQTFDPEHDACSLLYRRGDRKEPFCEGRTTIQYNFHGTGHWLTQLGESDLIDPDMRWRIAESAANARVERGREYASGEIRFNLNGLTALEEFALFMLDKSYIKSMLTKLRVVTGTQRGPDQVNIPETLYLHFLTQNELAELDEDALEEMEVFL